MGGRKRSMNKEELAKLFLEFQKWVQNENAIITREREARMQYRERAMFPLAGEHAPLPENIKPDFQRFMEWIQREGTSHV